MLHSNKDSQTWNCWYCPQNQPNPYSKKILINNFIIIIIIRNINLRIIINNGNRLRVPRTKSKKTKRASRVVTVVVIVWIKKNIVVIIIRHIIVNTCRLCLPPYLFWPVSLVQSKSYDSWMKIFNGKDGSL